MFRKGDGENLSTKVCKKKLVFYQMWKTPVKWQKTTHIFCLLSAKVREGRVGQGFLTSPQIVFVYSFYKSILTIKIVLLPDSKYWWWPSSHREG